MASYQLNVSGAYSVNSSSFGLSAPLAVGSGGTGSSDAGSARTALGLSIGSDVQAYNSWLQNISQSEPSLGQFLAYDGDNYVPTTGPVYSAGTALSLTGSTFSVSVDGSTIDALGAGGSLEVIDGSIGSSKLASNCINSDKLADGLIGDGLVVGGGGSVSVDGTVLRSSDSSIVKTSGSFALGGSITFQASEIQQVSGQSSYTQFDNFELLTTDGSSQSLFSINPSGNASTFFHVDIAVCSNDLSVCGQFSLDGLVSNLGGDVTALQLNASTSIYAYSGLASSLSVVGSNVVCSVVGIAGKNLRWASNVKQVVCPASS